MRLSYYVKLKIPAYRMENAMKEFKTYHPIVNFTYFFCVITLSMFFMNPVCLIISAAAGFIYSVMLSGGKTLKRNIVYILPLLLITALVNPLFNHEGMTIIAYFPGGNPLTLESMIYGAAAALMLAGVIFWFSCFNNIMTSDKFIYIFGKIIPSASLILTMTFRFVPKFHSHLKTVTAAQRGMRCAEPTKFKDRIFHAFTLLSAMITWALESSVTTADSMKSRGYGIGKRSSFSIYIMTRRDIYVLLTVTVLYFYIIFGAASGTVHFTYFPNISKLDLNLFNISVFAAYILLFTLPIIIEMRECLKWKYLVSKI